MCRPPAAMPVTPLDGAQLERHGAVAGGAVGQAELLGAVVAPAAHGAVVVAGAGVEQAAHHLDHVRQRDRRWRRAGDGWCRRRAARCVVAPAGHPPGVRPGAGEVAPSRHAQHGAGGRRRHAGLAGARRGRSDGPRDSRRVLEAAAVVLLAPARPGPRARTAGRCCSRRGPRCSRRLPARRRPRPPPPAPSGRASEAPPQPRRPGAHPGRQRRLGRGQQPLYARRRRPASRCPPAGPRQAAGGPGPGSWPRSSRPRRARTRRRARRCARAGRRWPLRPALVAAPASSTTRTTAPGREGAGAATTCGSGSARPPRRARVSRARTSRVRVPRGSPAWGLIRAAGGWLAPADVQLGRLALGRRQPGLGQEAAVELDGGGAVAGESLDLGPGEQRLLARVALRRRPRTRCAASAYCRSAVSAAPRSKSARARAGIRSLGARPPRGEHAREQDQGGEARIGFPSPSQGR